MPTDKNKKRMEALEKSSEDRRKKRKESGKDYTIEKVEHKVPVAKYKKRGLAPVVVKKAKLPPVYSEKTEKYYSNPRARMKGEQAAKGNTQKDDYNIKTKKKQTY